MKIMICPLGKNVPFLVLDESKVNIKERGQRLGKYELKVFTFYDDVNTYNTVPVEIFSENGYLGTYRIEKLTSIENTWSATISSAYPAPRIYLKETADPKKEICLSMTEIKKIFPLIHFYEKVTLINFYHKESSADYGIYILDKEGRFVPQHSWVNPKEEDFDTAGLKSLFCHKSFPIKITALSGGFIDYYSVAELEIYEGLGRATIMRISRKGLYNNFGNTYCRNGLYLLATSSNWSSIGEVNTNELKRLNVMKQSASNKVSPPSFGMYQMIGLTKEDMYFSRVSFVSVEQVKVTYSYPIIGGKEYQYSRIYTDDYMYRTIIRDSDNNAIAYMFSTWTAGSSFNTLSPCALFPEHKVKFQYKLQQDSEPTVIEGKLKACNDYCAIILTDAYYTSTDLKTKAYLEKISNFQEIKGPGNGTNHNSNNTYSSNNYSYPSTGGSYYSSYQVKATKRTRYYEYV